MKRVKIHDELTGMIYHDKIVVSDSAEGDSVTVSYTDLQKELPNMRDYSDWELVVYIHKYLMG